MTHLREWQRYQIAAKLEAGCTKKEIAEYLHVHPSTITREIQRNGYSRYRCYRPRIAQERAAHRWRCRRLPRRFKEDVRKKVDEMILMDYSPEQIVGVCRKQGIKMVSHETIYQYIWWDKAHGGELYKHLRHRGRRHKKRGALRKRRGTIPNRIDISERPKIVDRKNRVGDYEVDTIVGAARSQHILTLNDRKTGKVWLRKLENPTAAEAADQIIGILECLKQYDLVKTITADNGLQFAEHERVSRATSVGFFFARPYHSWERGANENTNGLIRQYIPKGSDFTNITQEFLEEVERKLNERPRKRHGFLSPNQVFSKSTGLDAGAFV